MLDVSFKELKMSLNSKPFTQVLSCPKSWALEFAILALYIPRTAQNGLPAEVTNSIPSAVQATTASFGSEMPCLSYQVKIFDQALGFEFAWTPMDKSLSLVL